ncbi:hypothetical protein ACI0FM_04125 [Paenochrobactrum sp. BZR 588]|uniref:hypothetical protein n=1 Tax=Paenochrobactrum TaxID=999488 RepID=UPI0035BBD1A1
MLTPRGGRFFVAAEGGVTTATIWLGFATGTALAVFCGRAGGFGACATAAGFVGERPISGRGTGAVAVARVAGSLFGLIVCAGWEGDVFLSGRLADFVVGALVRLGVELLLNKLEIAACGLLCCEAAHRLTAPTATIAPSVRTDVTGELPLFLAGARFVERDAVRGLRFAVAMRKPAFSLPIISFKD